MTRTEIETEVAEALNRGDLTQRIQFWFTIAHREVQRFYNKFTCTEHTEYITLVDGINSYDVPASFKEPILAYLWDETKEEVVAFYNKTNIESLRQRRFDDTVSAITFELYQYAIHAGKFELWPNVNSDITAYKFGIDHYRYLTVPAGDGSDWFTENAFDYLLYRTLREAVPFIGLSEAQENKWKTREIEAAVKIVGMDVSRQNSGPLRIRG